MTRMAWVAPAVVLATLAGCGGGTTAAKVAATPTTVIVDGDVTLDPGATPYSDPNFTTGKDGTCSGSGGYSDLKAGANVTIRDAGGKVIAVGSLTAGTAQDPQLSTGGPCTFTFAVFDVPAEAFYGVEVTHRGVVNYSRADVVARRVHLTLGS